MNSDFIYKILLVTAKTVPNRDEPLHGFSYRIHRNEVGCVYIEEHGHPTKIILWDKDGPELADLTEQMVKERIEEVLNG